MAKKDLEIAGCALFFLERRGDLRGSFLKIYNETSFGAGVVSPNWKEVYYSTSEKDVLRGMHFQTPPYEHDKLVHCLSGAVTDVVLDLRTSSPTYRQAISVTLTEEEPVAIYIPKGCAHGFLSLKQASTLLYLVTSEYHSNHDRGIRWDSFGFSWPTKKPVLSSRDQSFPELNSFESPFQ